MKNREEKIIEALEDKPRMMAPNNEMVFVCGDYLDVHTVEHIWSPECDLDPKCVPVVPAEEKTAEEYRCSTCASLRISEWNPPCSRCCRNKMDMWTPNENAKVKKDDSISELKVRRLSDYSDYSTQEIVETLNKLIRAGNERRMEK